MFSNLGGGCCGTVTDCFDLAFPLLRPLRLFKPFLVPLSDSMGESSSILQTILMSCQKFKDIHKKILEFRNQTLHGRYQKALAMIPAINNLMNDFQIGSTPSRRKLLDELTALFFQQVKVVQNLYDQYFKQPERAAKIELNSPQMAKAVSNQEPRLTERQIGKWGNKLSKSSVFLQPQVTKQYPSIPIKPILEESDPGIMQILEDRIVLPLTMPRFYKRIEDKVVLLEGDKRQVMQVVSDVASRSGSSIINLTQSVKNGSADLEKVVSSLNANNVIGVVEDIDQVPMELQAKLSTATDMFAQMKQLKSILILTCCSQQSISPLLNIDLRCRLGEIRTTRVKSFNEQMD